MIKLVNALGTEKILPETIIFRDVPFDLHVPVQSLHGRDGGVKTGETTITPRQFELAGRIYYPDKGRIEQEFDEILSILMQAPVKVYREHYHDRYLLAYALGAPHSWISKGQELEPRIPMLALNPLWCGQEVTVTVSGTQTITVDGNAPAIPFIQTTGSASSLTVTNQTTGKQIVVSGAGGVIRVDSVNHVVTIDGEERLDLANDDWVLWGFELMPGENLVSANTAVTMTYRPRWY